MSISFRLISHEILRMDAFTEFDPVSLPDHVSPRNGMPIFAGTDRALHVEFFNKAQRQAFKSENEGRPVFETKEYIRITVPEGKTVIEREVREDDTKRFPFQYQQFKAGAERSIVGFPIDQWPQLSLDQVEMLRALKIYSVEQLAAASDVTCQAMGLGGRELRAKAEAFLALAHDQAQAQKYAAENERLKDTLTDQQKQLDELRGLLQGKKGGRTAKED